MRCVAGSSCTVFCGSKRPCRLESTRNGLSCLEREEEGDGWRNCANGRRSKLHRVTKSRKSRRLLFTLTPRSWGAALAFGPANPRQSVAPNMQTIRCILVDMCSHIFDVFVLPFAHPTPHKHPHRNGPSVLCLPVTVFIDRPTVFPSGLFPLRRTLAQPSLPRNSGELGNVRRRPQNENLRALVSNMRVAVGRVRTGQSEVPSLLLFRIRLRPSWFVHSQREGSRVGIVQFRIHYTTSSNHKA